MTAPGGRRRQRRAAALSRRAALGAALLVLLCSAQAQAAGLRVTRATYETRQVAWHGEARARAGVPGAQPHTLFRVALFSVCVDGRLAGPDGLPLDGGAGVREQPALGAAVRLNCGRRHFGGLRVFTDAARGACGGRGTELNAALWAERGGGPSPDWGRECRLELPPLERRGAGAGPGTGLPGSFEARLERVVTRGAAAFHRRAAVAAGPGQGHPAAAAAAAAAAPPNATVFLETSGVYQQAPAEAGAGAAEAGAALRRGGSPREEDAFFRAGRRLPRASLRTTAVSVDGSVESRRQDEVRDYVAMIQIMHRTSSMTHATSRMIWELVVQPLLELLKKWLHCALEHLLAGMMMALLVPLLVDAVCAHNTQPLPPPAEPDMKAPPIDSPDTYDKTRREGKPARRQETAAAFLELHVTDRFGFRARARAGGLELGADEAATGVSALSRVKVRDYMAAQARAAAGGRELDLARFQSELDATHAARAAKPVTQPLIEDLVPRLRDALDESIADQAQVMMEKVLGADVIERMQDFTTRTVTRRTTRALLTSLTLEVTDSVVEATVGHLEKSLKEDTTGDLIKSIVPELTYSISSVVAKSLTRPPENDYYCYYCRTKQVYCDDCRGAMTAEYYLDVYVHYYARYFEAYYTAYYADYYAKIMTNHVGADGSWEGTDPEPEIPNRCLDPTQPKCTSAVNSPDQASLTEAKPG